MVTRVRAMNFGRPVAEDFGEYHKRLLAISGCNCIMLYINLLLFVFVIAYYFLSLHVLVVDHGDRVAIFEDVVLVVAVPQTPATDRHSFVAAAEWVAHHDSIIRIMIPAGDRRQCMVHRRAMPAKSCGLKRKPMTASRITITQ